MLLVITPFPWEALGMWPCLLSFVFSHPWGTTLKCNKVHLSYSELTPDKIATMLQLHQQANPVSAGPIHAHFTIESNIYMQLLPSNTQASVQGESDDASAIMSDANDESGPTHPFIDDIADEHDGNERAGDGAEVYCRTSAYSQNTPITKPSKFVAAE
ncbi:hypothetical protein IW262DRAFT_1298296 [Armillaria fumosa]|nr:hypothetical protein IW262DRAFT_1298296 [Armillaria fumosa]